MEVLLMLGTGVLCIACFLIGAKVGQKVSNGEDIKLPEVNPLKAYREREARKAAEVHQLFILQEILL